MKSLAKFAILSFTFTGILFQSCNQPPKKEKTAAPETPEVKMTLFDKSLTEIQQMINGKWELITGQNSTMSLEFENTYITFDNDTYIWSDDDGTEDGPLNWRKAATGSGYDSYLMDVFYEENPSYPLALRGDTLLIQDCSQTAYKYTLIKQK